MFWPVLGDARRRRGPSLNTFSAAWLGSSERCLRLNLMRNGVLCPQRPAIVSLNITLRWKDKNNGVTMQGLSAFQADGKRVCFVDKLILFHDVPYTFPRLPLSAVQPTVIVQRPALIVSLSQGYIAYRNITLLLLLCFRATRRSDCGGFYSAKQKHH